MFEEIRTHLQSSKLGKRHFQYFLFSVTVIVFHGIFTSLSVAIVPMTGDVSEKVEWTNPDMVLSAFFWAHSVPHILGAKIVDKFSPKWVLLFTMLLGSVFNIAVPPMSFVYGSSGAIVCRVFQGFCYGFLFPGLNALIKVWSPTCERTKVLNLVYGCSTIGTVICMPLSGFICSYEQGWPLIFYVFGSFGIFWTIIFAIFSKHSPAKHGGITLEERAYIEDSTNENLSIKGPTPWLHIVKSLPFWAILTAGSAHCWGGHTLLTQIPTYISTIMDFDITKDAFTSGLPYFSQLLVSLIIVPISHKLISIKTDNQTTIRKIFTALGSFLPAIFLTALAFIDSNQKNEAIAFLIISVGTSVFAQSGFLINVLDLSPDHSAALFSVLNTSGTIFSTLGPMTVGFLGNDKKDPILWRNVFLIAASIYASCGVFYCVFASAEEQEWNSLFEEDISNNKLLNGMRELKSDAAASKNFKETRFNALLFAQNVLIFQFGKNENEDGFQVYSAPN